MHSLTPQTDLSSSTLPRAMRTLQLHKQPTLRVVRQSGPTIGGPSIGPLGPDRGDPQGMRCGLPTETALLALMCSAASPTVPRPTG